MSEYDRLRAQKDAILQKEKQSIRLEAFRDLANAVKKVCPEIIPQLIAAAHPEQEFIEFLREAEHVKQATPPIPIVDHRDPECEEEHIHLRAAPRSVVDKEAEKGQPLSWAEETMLLINKLTPDVKGKAFDPDWFLLRQRLEQFERAAVRTEAARAHTTGEYVTTCPACCVRYVAAPAKEGKE